MGRSNHELVKVHIYESVAIECAETVAGTRAHFFSTPLSALSYVKRREECTQDQSLSTGNSMDFHLGCTGKVLQRGNISQYE